MCRYSAAAEAEVTISSLLTATPNFASLDATSSLDSVELLVTNTIFFFCCFRSFSAARAPGNGSSPAQSTPSVSRMKLSWAARKVCDDPSFLSHETSGVEFSVLRSGGGRRLSEKPVSPLSQKAGEDKNRSNYCRKKRGRTRIAPDLAVCALQGTESLLSNLLLNLQAVQRILSQRFCL